MACGPRRGRGGTGSDSGEVPARPELGDDPDRRAPPVSRPRERGARTCWAGRKNGPAQGKRTTGNGFPGRGKVFLGRGVKEKKRWAGGEKEKVLHFSETVQTLSI